jgi:glucans biosynthesis protein
MFMKCSKAFCVAWMASGPGPRRNLAAPSCARAAAVRCRPAYGKRRCFQHGGARGIGPPKGSQNARRHGLFSREAIAERRRINGFIRQCLQTLREIDEVAKRER